MSYNKVNRTKGNRKHTQRKSNVSRFRLKGGLEMEKYLTCEQVAERYGVKVITVWAWIREKKLPAIRIGKGYRVKPEDLEAFEEARRTK
jgi:excisionase family DNA binding protein